MCSNRTPLVVCAVSFALLLGTVACEPNTDSFATGLSTITVIVRNNVAYPIYQFRCSDVEPADEASESCPEGSGCDGRHYHGSPISIGRVAAISASDIDFSMVKAADPDQCHCGWGKVGDVDIRNLSIFVSDIDFFTDELTSGFPDTNGGTLTTAQAMSVDPCGG